VTPAGAIHIDLYHRAGNASGVQITSTRPRAVAQVFIGKTPEQLLDTVPLLFTLCGNAQAYAALLACRLALGMETEPRLDSARHILVQLETLREQVWRILLDWPGFVGLAPDKKALAALFKFDALFKRHLFRHGEAFKLGSCLNIDGAPLLTQLIDELETLIDQSVFNNRRGDFLTLTNETHLRDWLLQNDALPAKLLDYLYKQNWMASGQNDIACLPMLDADILRQHEELTLFSQTPHWQGRCFETTLLNRQLPQPLVAELHKRYGNGLIVRTVACLLEVASIPARLRRQLLSLGHCKTPFALNVPDERGFAMLGRPGDGIGLSQVQAARGLLIHRLELQQGRVYDYRIVAPTEWNFHPQGVVAQGLKHLTAANPSALQRQAALFVNAVDPCVQYTLRLIDERNEVKKHA